MNMSATQRHAKPYVPRRPKVARTVAELAAFTRRSRVDATAFAALAASLPGGDGSAVLVLPGVFRNDGQTRDLRRLLNGLGYVALAWELGPNYGPTAQLREGALARLQQVSAAHGRVSLVGFSMGGLFARWLSVRATDQVRQVISVGSPLRAAMQSAFVPSKLVSAAWRGSALTDLASEVEGPLPVPSTCVFSRKDGIVAWESCRDPARPDDNLEVACRHVMMEKDPDVFRIIAERLSRVAAPAS